MSFLIWLHLHSILRLQQRIHKRMAVPMGINYLAQFLFRAIASIQKVLLPVLNISNPDSTTRQKGPIHVMRSVKDKAWQQDLFARIEDCIITNLNF